MSIPSKLPAVPDAISSEGQLCNFDFFLLQISADYLLQQF